MVQFGGGYYVLRRSKGCEGSLVTPSPTEVHGLWVWTPKENQTRVLLRPEYLKVTLLTLWSLTLLGHWTVSGTVSCVTHSKVQTQLSGTNDSQGRSWSPRLGPFFFFVLPVYLQSFLFLVGERREPGLTQTRTVSSSCRTFHASEKNQGSQVVVVPHGEGGSPERTSRPCGGSGSFVEVGVPETPSGTREIRVWIKEIWFRYFELRVKSKLVVWWHTPGREIWKHINDKFSLLLSPPFRLVINCKHFLSNQVME